jgi:hypothetical protein
MQTKPKTLFSESNLLSTKTYLIVCAAFIGLLLTACQSSSTISYIPANQAVGEYAWRESVRAYDYKGPKAKAKEYRAALDSVYVETNNPYYGTCLAFRTRKKLDALLEQFNQKWGTPLIDFNATYAFSFPTYKLWVKHEWKKIKITVSDTSALDLTVHIMSSSDGFSDLDSDWVILSLHDQHGRNVCEDKARLEVLQWYFQRRVNRNVLKRDLQQENQVLNLPGANTMLPINYEEISSLMQEKLNVQRLSVVSARFQIDKNGRALKYELINDSEQPELAEMFREIAPKLVFPPLSIEDKNTPYQTLVEFSFQPNKATLLDYVHQNLDNFARSGRSHLSLFKYDLWIGFLLDSARNQAVLQKNGAGFTVFEKENTTWKLIQDQKTPTTWAKNEGLLAQISDYNGDGFRDLLMPRTSPSVGGGMQHSLWLFRSQDRQAVEVPEVRYFNEFQRLNWWKSYNLLEVRASESELGLQARSFFAWHGDKLKISEQIVMHLKNADWGVYELHYLYWDGKALKLQKKETKKYDEAIQLLENYKHSFGEK